LSPFNNSKSFLHPALASALRARVGHPHLWEQARAEILETMRRHLDAPQASGAAGDELAHNGGPAGAMPATQSGTSWHVVCQAGSHTHRERCSRMAIDLFTDLGTAKDPRGTRATSRGACPPPHTSTRLINI
jgi:hypothetical protein